MIHEGHNLKLSYIKNGSYVCWNLSDESSEQLYTFVTDKLNLSNALSKDKYHCTIVYSEVPAIGFSARGNLENPEVAKFSKYSIFTGQDGKPCLVIELDCPAAKDRHQFIKNKYNTVHSFPSYSPHITLTYDCGTITEDDLDTLPVPLFNFNFDEELHEGINLDWKG